MTHSFLPDYAFSSRLTANCLQVFCIGNQVIVVRGNLLIDVNQFFGISYFERILVKHQQSQSHQNPYMFVSPKLYEYIQLLRKQGEWSERKGLCPVSNFQYRFRSLEASAR